jgi:NTP pyrophosphatase (non-canonical NTP hydrolase)
MKYEDLLKQSREVREKYDELNSILGVVWDEQNYMAGFVGDVGDLSKIIMAKHGLRGMDDIDSKLAHELSDCLWSILILSDKYGIDLPAEFQKTMVNVKAQIDSQLKSIQSTQ